MHALKTMSMAVAIFAFAAAAVPAVADVIIPEDWFGIWEIEFTVYDCQTNDVLFSSTMLDTMCSGSEFEVPDPEGVEIDCTGSADANSYTLHCEGAMEVAPGCIMTYVYDATGTLSGDSYTSIATTTSSYAGDCFEIPDSCQRIETTGTRIDTCENVPVESYSWGTVKSLYR